MKKHTPKQEDEHSAEPISIRFKDTKIPTRLKEMREKEDLNFRQLVEVACAKLIHDYDRMGPMALVRPAPVNLHPPQGQQGQQRAS